MAGTGERLRIAAAGLSESGSRAVNEDAVAADVRQGIFVVADGASSGRAWNDASNAACQALLEYVAQTDEPSRGIALFQGIEWAHRRVLELGGKSCTTMVALYCDGKGAWIAHVGDSRAYLYRNGRLVRLTRDHKLVDEPGFDPARREKYQNILTRALGGALAVPDLRWEGIVAGDVFVLCTDGIWAQVDEAAMAYLLASDPPVEEACERLVAAAVDAGSSDNASVVVVRIAASSRSVAPPAEARPRGGRR